MSDLVVEFGGSMSGEHGDGLARSGWNAKLFGPEVYRAFGEVKRAFDPLDRMNPGKVVASPDPGESLRIGPAYRAVEPEDTAFDFAAQGGFARAVEMCSGVGACRKNGGGTMCPSYMVTLDEQHTTRARANTLRLVMTGAIPADGMDSKALDESLDLCLSCKACKTECPSNVDMSKLKAEYLHQKYRGKIPPLGSTLMAHIHRLSAMGSAAAPLANWTLRNPAFKWVLEKVAGIDRRRTLPTFAFANLRRWHRRHTPDPRAGTRGRVILLDDCFTTYNTPEVGRAAVRVLEASGYRVDLAGLPCCGRPAISKGLLGLARSLAAENVRRLVDEARVGTPILGCEPSCLLTLVDEYRDFRLGPDADLVAAAARLVDAFVADREVVPDLPLRTRAPSGSCSTAIASRRPWWGPPRPSRRCGGSRAWRSRSSIRAAAGWPVRSATRSATHEMQRGPGRTGAPARDPGRPRRPARRPRLLVPEPGPRPGRHRRSAPNRGHRRPDRPARLAHRSRMKKAPPLIPRGGASVHRETWAKLTWRPGGFANSRRRRAGRGRPATATRARGRPPPWWAGS